VRKKNITILIIVVLIAVGSITTGFAGLLLHFWYHQTHTGSYSGRVIDAVTGEPIEGAVVAYSWRFSGFLEESSATFYETLTDKEGKYFIPNQRVKRDNILRGTLQPESVLIYKNNYAVYTLWREYKKPPVGRSFGYPSQNQPYCKKNNLVKLYPWKKGESHDSHFDFIRYSPGYGGGTNVLLKEELREEEKRAEKERREKYNIDRYG